VKAYTFKDGLSLPANTQCMFHNYELNKDPEYYANPDHFDANRFLNMRRNVDQNKFQFSYVSEHSINFGAGRHSCPGRFFASNEMKLVLITLIEKYEMRWQPGKGLPSMIMHDFSRPANPMVDIMFKER
jgi:cytochrome P450